MLENEKINEDNGFLEEYGQVIKEPDIENETEADIDQEYKDLVDDDDNLELDLDFDWNENLNEGEDKNLDNKIESSLDLDNIDFSLDDDDIEINLDDIDFNVKDVKKDDDSIPKRAREIFNYVLEELEVYDSMKYAEDLQRYVLTKKKYEETTDREIEYLNSLSTSFYTENDRNDVNNWIRMLKNKDEVTLGELSYEIQSSEEIQSRLNVIYSEIHNEEKIGPFEKISDKSKDKIIRELDEILMEIEISLNNKFQEDKIRMSCKTDFNKPKKSPKLCKTIENSKAIYLAEDIVEIFNEGLSKANSRSKFYKLTATRAAVLDDSLNTEQIEEKYPEKINMTFSKYDESIRMFLSVIRNSYVDSLFRQICEKNDIEYKTTILKPFYIKYGDKVILLSHKYIYDDFISKAREIIEGSNVNTTGDEWYVRVYMDSRSYPEIFNSEYVTEVPTYKMYTNEELEYYIENIKSEIGTKNLLTLISNKAESKGLQKINTSCRIILAEILVKYSKIHKDRFKESISTQKVFDGYKKFILFEYLTKAINTVKYRVDTFGLDIDYVSALDLITIFNPKSGILAKLDINNLSAKDIYDSLDNEEVVKDLSLAELYIIPGIDDVKQSDLKSRKNTVPVFNDSYENAVILLKTFINNYNPDNILSLLNDNDEEENDSKKDKVGDSIMVKGENIKESHIEIIKHILKDIFEEHDITDEDEYVEELAKIYVNSVKPCKYSNDNDSRIYIRTGENEEYSSDEINVLKNSLEQLNVNDLRSGISYEDIDWIRRLSDKNEYYELNEIYNINDEFLNLVYSNSDLITDLTRLRLFSSDIKSVNEILNSVFKNLNKDFVDNYKSEELVKRSGIPSRIPVINRESVEIFVNNYYNSDYKIETIYNGINNYEEFTIKRDIAFFMRLFKNDVFSIYNKEKPRRFKNVLKQLLEASLQLEDTDLAEEFVSEDMFGYDIKQMINNAMIKLELVCPSTIDYNMIKTNLRQTLYYQKSGFIEEDIKARLKGYKYYVDDENYRKVGQYLIASKVIASLSQFIGNFISIEYVNDMNRKIDELTSKMEKIDVDELSNSSPTGERRRSNALYKAFLVKQDKRILKNVNRDLVDFDLLTKEPMADGTGGGEFSRTALIEEYELTEKTLAPEDSKDLDYFYTILAIESFNPEIIEYLPRPIIEYMESPIEIEDRFKNDKIFKSTKFKVQLI